MASPCSSVAASVDGEDAGGRVVGAPRRRHSGRSLTAFTALCDISRPAGSPRPQAVRPSWAPGHCQPPTAGLPAERGHGLLVGGSARLLALGSLAYPNSFGTKVYVVVVGIGLTGSVPL